MEEAISGYIAKNIKQLRQSRNLTQEQLARLSGVPRPTWANLESGTSNPTVSVLVKVASALQVPLEELISPPKASVKLYRADSIPKKFRGKVMIRRLIPDHLQSLEVDRMEFPVGSQMVGVPHRMGTREYLACESGDLELVVSGEIFRLASGDVVVFRGDQKHSYVNKGNKLAVAYSTVVLAPGQVQV